MGSHYKPPPQASGSWKGRTLSPIDLTEGPPTPALPRSSHKRARPASLEHDGVEALDEAPECIRRVSNRDQPIILTDSDDEDAQILAKRARFHIDDEPCRGESSAAASAQNSVSAGASTTTPREVSPGDLLPRVIEVLPDLDTKWAMSELRGGDPTRHDRVYTVIQAALDMEGGYPKEPTQKPEQPAQPELGYDSFLYKIDQRRLPAYVDQSLAALQDQFSKIPMSHILKVFREQQSLYYQSFFALAQDEALSTKRYVQLKRPRSVRGALPERNDKGKASTVSAPPQGSGEHAEWFKEYQFLMNKLERDASEAAETSSKQAAREAALAEEGGFECGCCFDDQLLEEMFQCTEGHLFCGECSTRHAEEKLGNQSTKIVCMDLSGCAARFPETELSRLLSSKSLDLYHRLKQASDIALASIDGLETCPGCDYAVIIDNVHEKLFRCQKDGCNKISCRKCRRDDHLPRSCAEAEADRKLDKRHLVEDAMSAALIRKCPTCDKPYVKESGCNKITCSGCRTISCYICRQAIPEGYAHFERGAQAAHTTTQSDRLLTSALPASSDGNPVQKCVLWDGDEIAKTQAEIIAARDAAQQSALQEAETSGISLRKSDLEIDAPGPSRPAGARPAIIPHVAFRHQHGNLIREAGVGPLAPQMEREQRLMDANRRFEEDG